LARGHGREDVVDAPGERLRREPAPGTGEEDRADLAERRREAAIVTALLRQLDRASVRFFRRVQVDLDGRPAVRLAERAPQDCLPELERGTKLGRRVTTLVRPRANA